jgi:hypothetical protein
MFGLGRRDDRAVDAVREEMSAADSRARAVLANAMAQIESRLSNDHAETARLQATTQAAIESLRQEVASRPSDIGPVLEQVAAMCALVAERLEADRIERRALTEAITLLARPAVSDAPSRVLGGMVLSPSEISLDEEAHAPAAPAAIDVEPAESRPVAARSVDTPPIDPRLVATPVDAPVAAPAFIDLASAEREPVQSASGTEIWNAFEKGRVDPPADDELDLRPRQGTRLTAARRSNAGASWR